MNKSSRIIFTSHRGRVGSDIVRRRPALRYTNLRKRDFCVGYGSERTSPGDREPMLTRVIRLVSGDAAATVDKVVAVCERMVKPGVLRASHIKAAETRKMAENTRRDLNLALVSELATFLDKVGIDITAVPQAAGTTWNFVKFKPGLLGGHCNGVDPHSLTHEAQTVDYQRQVMPAGPRIIEVMGKYIAEQVIKPMIASGSYIKGTKVNLPGLTFKEDRTDLRNSEVVDISDGPKICGVEMFLHDPEADSAKALHACGVRLSGCAEPPRANAIVVAMALNSYEALPLAELGHERVKGGRIVDVKAGFDAPAWADVGRRVWRLNTEPNRFPHPRENSACAFAAHP